MRPSSARWPGRGSPSLPIRRITRISKSRSTSFARPRASLPWRPCIATDSSSTKRALLSTALMRPLPGWRRPWPSRRAPPISSATAAHRSRRASAGNSAADAGGNIRAARESGTAGRGGSPMTKPRPFPAPTFHSMSLTRAAFFHARVGDTPALCSVLDHGLPADARNERGETLLHVACSNRRFDAARLLLERNASPESRSELGFTPLTTAVMDADRRLIALLLDHGADPDGAGPEGLTALMLAAMLDCVELVNLLLESGASLDLALADGSTALSMALGVEVQRAALLLLTMSSINRARPRAE